MSIIILRFLPIIVFAVLCVVFFTLLSKKDNVVNIKVWVLTLIGVFVVSVAALLFVQGQEQTIPSKRHVPHVPFERVGEEALPPEFSEDAVPQQVP